MAQERQTVESDAVRHFAIPSSLHTCVLRFRLHPLSFAWQIVLSLAMKKKQVLIFSWSTCLLAIPCTTVRKTGEHDLIFRSRIYCVGVMGRKGWLKGSAAVEETLGFQIRQRAGATRMRSIPLS